MCDCSGAQHPLPVSADPRDDIVSCIAAYVWPSGAQHPLPVSADPRDDIASCIAAYV